MGILLNIICRFQFIIVILQILFISCSKLDTVSGISAISSYKYLALGDSYTFGTSVCGACSFPNQLLDSLKEEEQKDISLTSIAQTGWTTSDLINGINTISPANDFDLVTLLIGVNNQFRRTPFSIFQNDFVILLEKAISLGNNNRNNIIVLSIPDYSYTPIGRYYRTPGIISKEIDEYNKFLSGICVQQNIYFQDITDISRSGLDHPNLVASDELHLSTIAYGEIVERIFKKASSILR